MFTRTPPCQLVCRAQLPSQLPRQPAAPRSGAGEQAGAPRSCLQFDSPRAQITRSRCRPGPDCEARGPCEYPRLVSVWPGHSTAPLLSRTTRVDEGLRRRPGAPALRLGNRCPSSGPSTPTFVVLPAGVWAALGSLSTPRTDGRTLHVGAVAGAPVPHVSGSGLCDRLV